MMLNEGSRTFLVDLKANNSREWFSENKQRYEADLKKPGADFARAFAEELSVRTGVKFKPKVYRIHRDLRFSKDKTPYNAHLHIAAIPTEGGADCPAFMFGLDDAGVTLGLGVFAFTRGGLSIWRDTVAGEKGRDICRLMGELEAQGARFSEEDLKRVPAPFKPEHPHGALLRRKGFAVWRDYADPTFVYSDHGPAKAVSEVLRFQTVFELLREILETGGNTQPA